MLLYLDISDYLRQWFVNDMGGGEPVRLPRNSVEHQFLETYLTAPPKGAAPDIDRTRLAIELPNFKSKDTRVCHYLSPKSRNALAGIIYNRFDLDLWQHVHRFSSTFRKSKDLIESFMELRGIEITDTNYNAVLKRYQRKRDYYMRRFRK